MLAQLRARVERHKASILPVLWGPVLGMAGLAIGTRVLTEVTPPAVFGEIKLVQGAVGLGIGLFARPLTQFAMREYHDAQQAGRAHAFVSYTRRSHAQVGVALAILTVAGLFAARSTGLSVSVAVALAAGAYMLAEVLIATNTSLALTRNEQRLVSLADVARQWGLPLAAAAAMYLLSTSAAIFVLTQAVFTFAVVALVVRATPTDASGAPPTVAEAAHWTGAAYRFALPMLGAGLFNWVISVGDRYILAWYCTADEVGRYAAVYGLISAPIVAAGGVISRFLYPFVFRAAARDDAAAQQAMFRSMFLVGGAVGVAAVGAVALVGPLIVAITLAPEYREGSQPLMLWLAAGHACLIVAFSLDMKAYAGRHTLAVTVASGVAAVVNVGLNLLWIPRFAAVGAAMATFAGYFAYLVVNTLMLSYYSRSGAPSARSPAGPPPP